MRLFETEAGNAGRVGGVAFFANSKRFNCIAAAAMDLRRFTLMDCLLVDGLPEDPDPTVLTRLATAAAFC